MARVNYKGFDLPDGAAIPDVPSDLRALVDGGPIPRFANTTARDTAISTPVAGAMCYVSDIAQLQIHTGTAWRVAGAGALLGQVTLAASTAATTAEAIWATVNITLTAPRTLRCIAMGSLQKAAGTATLLGHNRIRDGGIGGTEVAHSYAYLGQVQNTAVCPAENTRQYATGAHTFVATYSHAGSDTAITLAGAQFAIFDAGG